MAFNNAYSYLTLDQFFENSRPVTNFGRNRAQYRGPAPGRSHTLPMCNPPAPKPVRSYSQCASTLNSKKPWENRSQKYMFWDQEKGCWLPQTEPHNWVMGPKEKELLYTPKAIRQWDDFDYRKKCWVTWRIYSNGDMEESLDQGWTWKNWCPININPWKAAYPPTIPIDQSQIRQMEKLWFVEAWANRTDPKYKMGQNFTKGKPWEHPHASNYWKTVNELKYAQKVLKRYHWHYHHPNSFPIQDEPTWTYYRGQRNNVQKCQKEEPPKKVHIEVREHGHLLGIFRFDENSKAPETITLDLGITMMKLPNKAKVTHMGLKVQKRRWKTTWIEPYHVLPFNHACLPYVI